MAEEAQEEQFGRRVGVEAASDEKVGNGDAVCVVCQFENLG